ncbi:MAG: 3'-5' exonuclease, partial [Candidatus Saccharimonadales bacterium]
RSRQEILDLAKSVISGASTRLEKTIDEVDKELVAANKQVATGNISCKRLATPEHQYLFVAEEIARLLKKGESASDIAVLARQHTYLEQLMPYLREADIPVTYERRSNVLDQHHITQLLDLAYLIYYLANDEQETANAYLSKVLSYPFWGIDPIDIWRLSRQAYQERELWLDMMIKNQDAKLQSLAKWLLACKDLSKSQPLEHLIDVLVGVKKLAGFKSPYQDYYFSSDKFASARGEYIAFLSALKLLRSKLRQYHHSEVIYLKDLVSFIDTHRDNDIPIVDETPFVSHEDSVEVMSAHKAKGLEFKTVFIVDCQEEVWTSSKSRQNIRFPENLPVTPAGDHLDDQLRLFFVAMTRAKSNLYLLGHKHNHKGKESLLMPFLDHQLFEDIDTPDTKTAEILETSWQSYHPLPREADAKAVLKPILQDYQLNPTAYNKFLNLVRGGPKSFLLESLLKFPQAPSVSASYGTAIHNTLSETYHLLSQGKQPSEQEIIDIFKHQLHSRRLKPEDEKKMLTRGEQALRRYLKERYSYMDPEHLIEIDFAKQGVVIAGVPIAGKIDKLVLNKDKKTADIYDFKTAKPVANLRSKSDSEEGLKAWQYRTQLIFYKLLLENSRSWSEYSVDKIVLEFIEPDRKTGEIVLLESDVTSEEVDRTTQLMKAIYSHIQNLDFPETDKYDKNLKGIEAFENDLLGKQG